ncbi:MAG: CDP-2,3-bis-(O-geranylgeranyl)-sn-glycerol synthase [Candidatus Pacearchaeota archaeon]|nr:CDP-2,3-bis-(O-geranylgeranyl)-sn-glycerol synthase [Candidatus Pacearchaeota archaeon]
MSIFLFLIQCIWFALPAYAANIFASLSAEVKFLQILGFPIDFYQQWKGKRILGDNKTIRGFLIGTFFAILVSFFQHILFKNELIRKISFFDYSKNFLLLGFLLGLGALVGDSFGSFIKRRLNIPCGERFLLLDQLSFICFALLFASFIYPINIKIWLVLLPLTFLLHIVVNHLAFYLKIKKAKW